MEQLSGYLLASGDSQANAVVEELLQKGAIKRVQQIPRTRWETLTFESNDALSDDERINPRESGKPYQYLIYCRTSPLGRMLMAAKTKKIVDWFLANLAIMCLDSPLRTIGFRVKSLVEIVVRQPDKYALTFVHARVAGFGDSLNAMGFYGEDLAEAKLFRDNLAVLNSISCGLRPIGMKSEVMRVTSEGGISFYFAPGRARHIASVLQFIHDSDCLEV